MFEQQSDPDLLLLGANRGNSILRGVQLYAKAIAYALTDDLVIPNIVAYVLAVVSADPRCK